MTTFKSQAVKAISDDHFRVIADSVLVTQNLDQRLWEQWGVKISPSVEQDGTLSVDVQLPEGWKIKELGPETYTILDKKNAERMFCLGNILGVSDRFAHITKTPGFFSSIARTTAECYSLGFYKPQRYFYALLDKKTGQTWDLPDVKDGLKLGKVWEAVLAEKFNLKQPDIKSDKILNFRSTSENILTLWNRNITLTDQDAKDIGEIAAKHLKPYERPAPGLSEKLKTAAFHASVIGAGLAFVFAVSAISGPETPENAPKKPCKHQGAVCYHLPPAPAVK